MTSTIVELRPPEYRSVWISDVHLGYRDCKADLLLDFLKSVNSDYLYLVGDIIDLWSMKKSVHWPQEHNNVVRTILSKAKRGVRVVYIPAAECLRLNAPPETQRPGLLTVRASCIY